MIRAHRSRTWLWLLLAAALAMRAFVPQGYMVTAGQDQIAISICTGQGPMIVLVDRHGDDHSHGDKQDAAQQCAFADLTVPGLTAVPPVALALALAFILALWLAEAAPLRLTQAGRLRPPLRGPPSRI
ncbi:MAG: DUF2946 family protein [Altererythrobacter sp.]|nr:DUF2946 family protein [Altererythrobacter sp.]OJU59234.1 MAG: hypothetical protein BGO08_06245 [Altererythrobacter sp. 66-12]